MLMKKVNSKAQDAQSSNDFCHPSLFDMHLRKTKEQSHSTRQAQNEIIMVGNCKIVRKTVPFPGKHPHQKIDDKTAEAAYDIDRPALPFKNAATIKSKVCRQQINTNKPG